MWSRRYRSMWYRGSRPCFPLMMTRVGLRAYSSMPNPQATPCVRDAWDAHEPPVRSIASPGRASSPIRLPSSCVSAGLCVTISNAMFPRGEMVPARLWQLELLAVLVENSNPGIAVMHHLADYGDRAAHRLQRSLHHLDHLSRSGEQEFVVLAAGQSKLQRPGSEVCLDRRFNRQVGNSDAGADLARLADMAEVGDEAVTDVDGCPHSALGKDLALRHTRRRVG